MSARLAQGIPAADVERALAAVLESGELAGPEGSRRTLIEQLIDWIDGLAGSLGLPPGIAEGIGGLAMVVLVGAVLAVAALLIARLVRAARDADALPGSGAVDRRERVRELLAQASGARERGERQLALRLYFLALVVGLSQAGELEYREAWTYRELLERGQPSPRVLGELRPLQGELDRKSFGGEAISEADLERVIGLCGRWLGAAGAGGRA